MIVENALSRPGEKPKCVQRSLPLSHEGVQSCSMSEILIFSGLCRLSFFAASHISWLDNVIPLFCIKKVCVQS